MIEQEAGRIHERGREAVGFFRQIAQWFRHYLFAGLRLSRTEDPLWVVVHAVVVQDDEVLLVKRTVPRAWELPGGFPERNEYLLDAVVREVREETGLAVRIERCAGMYVRSGFFAHISTVFVCVPEDGQLRSTTLETLNAEFYPVDRLPRGLFPWHRQVIRDAVNGNSRPVARHQHLGLRTVAQSLYIAIAMQTGMLR